MAPSDLERVSDGDGAESVIEFCLNNVTQEQRSALSRREGTVRGCACLQRCGDCAVESFVVIDGRYVAGDPLETVAAVGDTEGSR